MAAWQSDQTNCPPCEGPVAVAAVVEVAVSAAVVDVDDDDAVVVTVVAVVTVAAAVGLWQQRYPAAAKGTLPAGSTGWTGFREVAEKP